MAYVQFQKINKTQYLYGALPFRSANGTATRKATCLGKIDPLTNDLVIGKNFTIWMEKYGTILKNSINDMIENKEIKVNFHNIHDNTIVNWINCKAGSTKTVINDFSKQEVSLGYDSPEVSPEVSPEDVSLGASKDFPDASQDVAREVSQEDADGVPQKNSETTMHNVLQGIVNTVVSSLAPVFSESVQNISNTIAQEICQDVLKCIPKYLSQDMIPRVSKFPPEFLKNSQTHGITTISNDQKNLNSTNNSNYIQIINQEPSDISNRVMNNNYNISNEFVYKTYGQTYLLNHIISDSGLSKILNSVFSKDEANKLITLAQFVIIEKSAISNCDDFARDHYTLSSPNSVSSPRTSEFLDSISRYQRDKFYKEWSSYIADNEYLVLDLTNFVTYSKNNPYAAYGKPKSSNANKRLKQINQSLLFGEKSGLPVYTDIYDGSLNDVSLLVDSVKNIQFVNAKNFKLVLDRGFYSNNNIKFMVSSAPKIPFLVGMPATTNLKKQLILDNKHIVDNPNLIIDCARDNIFGTTKQITLDGRKFYTHIYVNLSKSDSRRRELLLDFKKLYCEACQNPVAFLNDIDKRRFLQFSKSKASETGYVVKMNDNAFKEALSNSGWFVFLGNEKMNAVEAFKIYQKRDIVEKGFYSVKTRFGMNRPRTGNPDITINRSFVGFLSLIILSQIHNVMSDNNLYKQFTIQKLLRQLSTIKIHRKGNVGDISPITVKQRKILDYFHCPYPSNISL
jgi:transposase